MTTRTLPADLYERLRLPDHGVTQGQIAKAYQDQRRELDPKGEGINQEQMAEIGLAYDVLGNEVSRAEYDEYLKSKSRRGMSDGTFKRRRPSPTGTTGAPGPAESPDQPQSYPVPTSKVRPSVWKLVPHLLWRLDTMEISAKVMTTLVALILVPTMIVTIFIGAWQAEAASIALLLGITYLMVRCWSSMRLAQQIWLGTVSAVAVTAAVVVVATWPLTLHILVGIFITCIVLVAIRIALIFA